MGVLYISLSKEGGNDFPVSICIMSSERTSKVTYFPLAVNWERFIWLSDKLFAKVSPFKKDIIII